MPRIFWPNKLKEAHGPSPSTLHSSLKAEDNRSSAAPSRLLAVGSKETVTLVSDVETRSTDIPCCLNTWNASAKKPTWCHIPGLSIETNVMPFLIAIALTCAALSPTLADTTVPSSCGACVAYTCNGILYWRTGSTQRGCKTFAPLLAISCASS